jgi:hypothetical protein
MGLATTLSLILLLALSGCGAPETEQESRPQSTATSTPSPSPDQTDHAVDDGGEGDGGVDDGGSDGGEDPAQDRVRTGPVAQYGGPAYGDQGVAEVIEAGLWCKTIAVFWGGDPVPDGVRFTFEGAVTDRSGLEVQGGVCGSRGADRSCLGMTVEANASGIFCSIVLRPGDGFQDGTALTFTGTLECPTAEICDAVVARDVQPGPPIVVNDPGPADEEQAPVDPAPAESPSPQPEEG